MRTIAVEISSDRRHTAVAGAAGRADGSTVVEVIAYLAGSDTAGQVAAVVARYDITEVVVDPRSPAATLIAPLERCGLSVKQPTPTEVAIAHGIWVDEMRAGRVRHVDHPALAQAVQHAEARHLAGAEAVERRRAEADTSPLVAVQLALWALLTVPPMPRIYG